MNLKQFEYLKSVEAIKASVIKGSDLVSKRPRTLLYGYNSGIGSTMDYATLHVYLIDGKIVIHWYSSSSKDFKTLSALIEDDIADNEAYIPQKRLYPESCDFDFCHLLRQKGIILPFTTWDNERYNKVRGVQYHGALATI